MKETFKQLAPMKGGYRYGITLYDSQGKPIEAFQSKKKRIIGGVVKELRKRGQI